MLSIRRITTVYIPSALKPKYENGQKQHRSNPDDYPGTEYKSSAASLLRKLKKSYKVSGERWQLEDIATNSRRN